MESLLLTVFIVSASLGSTLSSTAFCSPGKKKSVPTVSQTEFLPPEDPDKTKTRSTARSEMSRKKSSMRMKGPRNSDDTSYENLMPSSKLPRK
uniref:Secreted protein n=1 Tax=Steinernema glaseri TaxID=37863 RepID=A0A1I8ATH5_9BILA